MSNIDFVITAEVRNDLGKGASRRLRREGKVPAVIYGGGKDPMGITLAHKDLAKNLENEAFYSHILTINVNGNSEKGVLKDLQRHPSKPFVMHADFLRVSADEKLRMHVPLHFINEEAAPGVKAGGLVTHNMVEVEINCLPRDLPEFIEVDLGSLELNGLLHLSDLKLPEGVELMALTHGADHDLPVVSIHMTRGAMEAAEGEEEGGE